VPADGGRRQIEVDPERYDVEIVPDDTELELV
jgi:hypothetical protein